MANPGTYLDLQGVLNVLAGTTDLDTRLAANIWSGWVTGSTQEYKGLLELDGALNYKHHGSASAANAQWQDFNGICTALAAQLAGYNTAHGVLEGTRALNLIAWGQDEA